MSGGRRFATTRVELLRARRELARVRQGATLVRRKREALVMQLFRAARPAMELREQLGAAATAASEALLDALAAHGRSGLAAMSHPLRRVEITLEPGVVWGIPVSDIIQRPTLLRTLDARGTDPALTGPAAATAAERFERLADLLIDAAPREQRVRRLGDAVAQASRMMRTLEQRVAPELERRITLVRRQLEEREREDRIRLRHLAGRRRH